MLERRLHEIVEGTAKLYGAKADSPYQRRYPVLKGPRAERIFCSRVAGEIAGDRVDVVIAGDGRGGFLLHARGAARRLLFIGNGESAALHHPAYIFNDEVIPVGTLLSWCALAEIAMAGQAAAQSGY